MWWIVRYGTGEVRIGGGREREAFLLETPRDGMGFVDWSGVEGVEWSSTGGGRRGR